MDSLDCTSDRNHQLEGGTQARRGWCAISLLPLTIQAALLLSPIPTPSHRRPMGCLALGRAFGGNRQTTTAQSHATANYEGLPPSPPCPSTFTNRVPFTRHARAPAFLGALTGIRLVESVQSNHLCFRNNMPSAYVVPKVIEVRRQADTSSGRHIDT